MNRLRLGVGINKTLLNSRMSTAASAPQDIVVAGPGEAGLKSTVLCGAGNCAQFVLRCALRAALSFDLGFY